MSEISLGIGPVQIPENRFWKIICWLPKKLAGTHSIDRKLDNLTQHIQAMTDIFHIIVADVSAKWDADKRERVQRIFANFTLVNQGLATAQTKSNPLPNEELERLRAYTRQAQQGQVFTSDQAFEYRQLSERASREYVGQDWVGELLKIALFIFALYAIGKLLESK